jgi:iron complex outermembrane recepter protein
MGHKQSMVSWLLLLPSLGCATLSLAGSPATGDESAGGLEEIIVTATRREESSQKAAIAVQAITADELSRAGVTQPEDLNALAPGVNIGSGGSFPMVYIRGVGNFVTNTYAEGAVAMNVDGVYVSRPWATRGSFFDLDRIEVLKGPQGTLYGRNASGGAINLISAQPTNELGGYVEVGGGDYNLWRGTGAINVPITPDLAIRAAGQIIHRDGYLSDGYDDERSESARLRALWTPSANLSLLLTGTYQHLGGMGGGPVLSPPVGGNPWLGPSDPATAAIYKADPIFGPFIHAPDRLGYADVTVYSPSAELKWRTDAGTLTVIPAYRDAKYPDRSMAPGFILENHEHDRQTSVETRFSRESDWLRFVAGGYYFDEKQGEYGGQPLQLIEQGIAAQKIGPLANHTRSYAGFGQATGNVTPTLRFTGGLRYTYERKETSGSSIAYGFPSQTPPPVCPGVATFYPDTPQPPLYCGILFPLQSTLSYNSWTYKVGAEYDLAPQSMLFANVSTGFKSGGFYPAPPPNTFKPEKLTAFELGSKNRFFNSGLQFNAEAFYWEYHDHQESHVGPTSLPGLSTFITENAGRATLYGLDIDGILLITQDDRLDVKAQYEHSWYNSFSYTNDTALFGAPATGCAVGPVVNGQQRVDCAGKQVVKAPSWSGTVSYDHTFRLGDAGQLTASAQTQFASGSYVTIDFLPDLRQEAYALVNLNLKYLEPRARWSVSAYMRNVGNKPVYTQGLRFPFSTPLNSLRPEGVDWVTIGAPRTFGGQFRYNF